MEVIEYRTIEGFTRYRVGNDGSIWRHCRGAGHRTRPERWKRLAGCVQQGGYIRVRLYHSGGGMARLLVHRIVLEAFVGPCPEGKEACHGDGDPTNNALDNLRWDTRKNNCWDAEKHGTSSRGERNGNAKLTIEQVEQIKKEYVPMSRIFGGPSLAKKYGVSQTTISDIIAGNVYSQSPALKGNQ